MVFQQSAAPLALLSAATCIVAFDRWVCSEGFLRQNSRVLFALREVVSGPQADRYGVVVVGLLCLSAFIDPTPPGWLFCVFMASLAATLYLYSSAARALESQGLTRAVD